MHGEFERAKRHREYRFCDNPVCLCMDHWPKLNERSELVNYAQHTDAARSSARFLLKASATFPHTEAVADCPHCNALFLARWALATLESPQSADAVDPHADSTGKLTTRV